MTHRSGNIIISFAKEPLAEQLLDLTDDQLKRLRKAIKAVQKDRKKG